MKLEFIKNANYVDWKNRTHKDVYVLRCDYSEKDVVKSAGFFWNPPAKVWYTPYKKTAARFYNACVDETLKAELEAIDHERTDKIESSRAADANIEIPAPDGLSYLPFQRAGIAFGREKESVLFGDEMGLGKTIQAIGLINIDPTVLKVLVVCPASLKLNWRDELNKWLVRPMKIHVHKSDIDFDDTADIVIINYDILKKFHDDVHSKLWDMIIVDECHYLKNPKAQRTKEVVGEYISFKNKSAEMINKILAEYNVEKENDYGVKVGELAARKKIFLTGTPIPNRPIELFPIVNYLFPKQFYFKAFMLYAKRFCGAKHNGYGWDFSGASNLSQLQELLRTSIMIRRLKKDVLTELPPKFRQIIELPLNGNRKIVDREQKILAEIEANIDLLKTEVELAKASDDPKDYERAVAKLREAVQVAFEEMSAARHETALAKIPDVIDHIENIDHKVLVFAHHRDVVEAIHNHFGDRAVKLYGGMKEDVKNDAVNKFQNDDNVKVFVGSIQAAGVGLTLTAASHVVFAELDWVPGNVTQAEDRAHRIGQTDNVLVQHIVLEGSLDAVMAKKLVAKQNVIDAALDKNSEIDTSKFFVTPGKDASTKNVKKSRIEKIAEKLTDDHKFAIRSALSTVAGMCDGANALDDYGFNKIDARIGRELAHNSNNLTNKQYALAYLIVYKYKRQYGDELAAIMKTIEKKES